MVRAGQIRYRVAARPRARVGHGTPGCCRSRRATRLRCRGRCRGGDQPVRSTVGELAALLFGGAVREQHGTQPSAIAVRNVASIVRASRRPPGPGARSRRRPRPAPESSSCSARPWTRGNVLAARRNARLRSIRVLSRSSSRSGVRPVCSLTGAAWKHQGNIATVVLRVARDPRKGHLDNELLVRHGSARERRNAHVRHSRSGRISPPVGRCGSDGTGWPGRRFA